jgi:hypothetical protein
MFKEAFNLDQVGVIEASVSLAAGEHEKLPRGFYFEKGAKIGYALLFNRTETVYGLMNRDGSALTIFARVKRDMDFGPTAKVRVIVKQDMMEAYVNDYLVMVKRVYWNGRLGVIGQADTAKDFRAWTHE